LGGPAAGLGRGELDGGRTSLRLDNDAGPLEHLARTNAGAFAIGQTSHWLRHRRR
jgi:hypothetical protein